MAEAAPGHGARHAADRERVAWWPCSSTSPRSGGWRPCAGFVAKVSHELRTPTRRFDRPPRRRRPSRRIPEAAVRFVDMIRAERVPPQELVEICWSCRGSVQAGAPAVEPVDLAPSPSR